MTTFRMPNDNHSNRASSSAVADAVMRATAILALIGIAVIHLVQLVPTFRSTPLLGAAFVALIVASLAVGARLVGGSSSHVRLWLPIAALGFAAIGGYAFTRVVSTPFDNQDVGNWSCMLGMAALFVEGILVALSAYAISVPQQRHRAAVVSRIPVPASSPVRVRQLNRSGS